METCSSGHDEVCYNSRSCPVCEVIEEMEDLKKDLSTEIESLEDSLSRARDTIDSLKDKN